MKTWCEDLLLTVSFTFTLFIHYILRTERLICLFIANSWPITTVALHNTPLQSPGPCTSDDAFLSSTKSNAPVMLVPLLPPITSTTPSVHFYSCLSLWLSLKVDWELLIEGLAASLFRGTGRKQSTLTQKPSGATTILIFLARNTYLYIGLY